MQDSTQTQNLDCHDFTNAKSRNDDKVDSQNTKSKPYKKHILQFSGYFLVALVAVSVNIISRILLNLYFSFYLSVVIAYILGHFVNFYLSNRFIFRATPSLRGEAIHNSEYSNNIENGLPRKFYEFSRNDKEESSLRGSETSEAIHKSKNELPRNSYAISRNDENIESNEPISRHTEHSEVSKNIESKNGLPRKFYEFSRNDKEESSLRGSETSEAIHKSNNELPRNSYAISRNDENIESNEPNRHCERGEASVALATNPHLQIHTLENQQVDCHDLNSSEFQSRNDKEESSLRGSETTEAIHKSKNELPRNSYAISRNDKNSHSKNTFKKFLKFSLVASFGLCVAFVVSAFSLQIFLKFQFLNQAISEFIAHICGIGASFVFNFLGHKFFSFREV